MGQKRHKPGRGIELARSMNPERQIYISNKSPIQKMNRFMVGFGLFEGLWLAVGINPESQIIKAFTGVLRDLDVGIGYIFLLNILPVLALIGTLTVIGQFGGRFALATTFVAFLSGLFLVLSPTFGAILFIAALIMASQIEET